MVVSDLSSLQNNNSIGGLNTLDSVKNYILTSNFSMMIFIVVFIVLCVFMYYVVPYIYNKVLKND